MSTETPRDDSVRKRQNQTRITSIRRNRSPMRAQRRQHDSNHRVLAGLQLPTLKVYSAAPQVGKNVAKKIRLHLEERGEVLGRIREQHRRFGQPLNKSNEDDVLIGLENLRKKVAHLKASKTAGMGHNNPPDDMNLTVDEINDVVEAIDDLKSNVVTPKTDFDLIRALAKKIANFGTKAFIWSGQRVTDFAKSAAITAGGGFGVWLSGLGETIVSTLRKTLRLFLPYIF